MTVYVAGSVVVDVVTALRVRVIVDVTVVRTKATNPKRQTLHDYGDVQTSVPASASGAATSARARTAVRVGKIIASACM